MTLGDVERWYQTHGEQPELPGERTWIGRLWNYESFLDYHNAVWEDLCMLEASGQLEKIIESNMPLYEMIKSFKSANSSTEL